MHSVSLRGKLDCTIVVTLFQHFGTTERTVTMLKNSTIVKPRPLSRAVLFPALIVAKWSLIRICYPENVKTKRRPRCASDV